MLLAINKTDDKRAQAGIPEFFQLGFDPVIEISAEHGHGVAELLDEIVKQLGAGGRACRTRRGLRIVLAPPTADRSCRARRDRDETRVAIVGRPNVGKSSLVNRLLREERVLVSDMPGTTRDAIDAPLVWHRRRFRIVDTAGMRRAGRIARGGKVEMVSVARARESIADADVVALVIDANRRRRPIRTPRSAVKPTARAAASSSSRTSGIS